MPYSQGDIACYIAPPVMPNAELLLSQLRLQLAAG